MAGNIKGVNIEIGASTTKFNQALKEMSVVTKKTQNELNAVNKALKFAPKNVDLLNQKEELLAKQLEDTRAKVDKLKAAKAKADADMANGTEVNQEQYRILVREISATEGQLKSLIRQNDKFGNSARELGENITGIGKKGMAISGAIIGIGTAAVSAMSAAAENTREYREDMNKLETAFKTGGFAVDAAKKSYEDFYTILGETDRSVEAVNHLARFVETEQDLAKWSDIAAGVNATFTDSLPLEGLTEAANETAKVGKVTGVLADAINWASEETEVFKDALSGNQKALSAFNKAISDGEALEDAYSAALAEMSTEQERSQFITNTLNELYKDAAGTYKELNADIIANRRATSEANDQMAKLGASSEGINTKLQQAKNTIAGAVLPTIGQLADKISDLDEGQIKLIGGIGAVTLAVPAVITGAGQMITAIGTISTAYKTMAASATAASIASKAIPFIGVAAGAITLIGAISALASSTDEETQKVRELNEANRQRYEDYQELKLAAQERAESSLSEISHIQNLKNELMLLADESGRVTEADRARAEFIIGQLNGALGTEITMTGNVIDKYGELSIAIDALILKKKADIILSSKEDAYKTAIQNIEAQAEATRKSAEELDTARERYENYAESIKDSDATGFLKELQESELNTLKIMMENKQKVYDEDLENYINYQADIADFEQASISMAEDGGKSVVAAWQARSTGVESEQEKIGLAFNQTVLDLITYEENYRNGVEGYTEAGLAELRSHVEELKTEAQRVGVSINEGVAVGLSNTSRVQGAIARVCSMIPAWMKELLGINSPAKVAIPIGEAIPEGIAVGIEKDMSAEEALEKKVSNLKKILSDFTADFKADIDLAESEYDLWLAENPTASDFDKEARQKAMLEKQIEAYKQNVQDINDALWWQGELTGEDSTEYKQMLAQLYDARKDLKEKENELAELNKYKQPELTPTFSQATYDLAEGEYILWQARNPEATAAEQLAAEEKKLNTQYEEQGKKVQDLNDELYLQIQLNGENAEESKKLLDQLKREKAAYEQLAAEIARVNEEKSKSLAQSHNDYISYKAAYSAGLKSVGYSEADIEAAARKASGYNGSGTTVTIQNNNYGVTPETAYEVSKKTEQTANNLAMQGVL